MEIPVLAPDEHTYERGAIEQALQASPISPITRQPMRLGDLKLNRALRDAIAEWRAEQPMAFDPDLLEIMEEEVLGRGAFGLVVAGILTTHGKRLRVAVKTLQDVSGTEARARFDAELKAHLTAQQGADGVCRLLGTCTKNHRLCIVMKRYEGSLRDRLAAGPLEPNEVQRIAHGLCRTLVQLHAVGVVVRDIKPENVLFDEHEQPVIADFGISEVVTRTTLIVPSSAKGTFNYMSPDSFEVMGHGPEVDVWAMGCLVVEMSTGVMPFAGLQVQQIVRAVCDRRDIPNVPDNAPAPDVVRRCFEFDRANRPTAARLAAALKPTNQPSDSGAPVGLGVDNGVITWWTWWGDCSSLRWQLFWIANSYWADFKVCGFILVLIFFNALTAELDAAVAERAVAVAVAERDVALAQRVTQYERVVVERNRAVAERECADEQVAALTARLDSARAQLADMRAVRDDLALRAARAAVNSDHAGASADRVALSITEPSPLSQRSPSRADATFRGVPLSSWSTSRAGPPPPPPPRSTPIDRPPPVRAPPGTIFRVERCEVEGINGNYRETCPMCNGKTQYKNDSGQKIFLGWSGYGGLVCLCWNSGRDFGIYHEVTSGQSRQRPPRQGWLRCSDNALSATRVVYVGDAQS
jgi:hypothetical protein